MVLIDFLALAPKYALTSQQLKSVSGPVSLAVDDATGYDPTTPGTSVPPFDVLTGFARFDQRRIEEAAVGAIVQFLVGSVAAIVLTVTR